jgi:hypothetical protein
MRVRGARVRNNDGVEFLYEWVATAHDRSRENPGIARKE